MIVSRKIRQAVGFISARFSEFGFTKITDPRQRGNILWSVSSVLKVVLCGLMSRCLSLKEVEALTDNFDSGMKRLASAKRRMSDTTMRDLLCRLVPQDLRQLLYQVNLRAFRRKACAPVDLPFGVVAMDGKWNTLKTWDEEFVQRRSRDNGSEYGLLRTITSTLSSAAAKPCLDVHPVPYDTNEMGVFTAAFEALCKVYRTHFQVVSYDAGVTSRANAETVVAAGKDYVFRLKNEKHGLLQLAQETLSGLFHDDSSTDEVNKSKHVIRRVTLLNIEEHKHLYDEYEMWSHAKTIVKITVYSLEPDGSPLPMVNLVETRIYISSLGTNALTPKQWLALIRAHWSVENNCHHTFDTAFKEDDKPWIHSNGRGALNVLILRRIAYTMLALFRGVTLRSEENRKKPWKMLMEWLRMSMYKATEKDIANLRQRKAMIVYD